eukprot:3087116-Amphidinium_carterae.1
MPPLQRDIATTMKRSLVEKTLRCKEKRKTNTKEGKAARQEQDLKLHHSQRQNKIPKTNTTKATIERATLTVCPTLESSPLEEKTHAPFVSDRTIPSSKNPLPTKLNLKEKPP